MRNFLLVAIFAMLAGNCEAQTGFEQFANDQSQQFVASYEKRDTAGYRLLLNDFLVRYNNLKPKEQAKYKGFLQNAFYNFCCTLSLIGDADRALYYLQEAIDAGYVDYAHMQEDTDLDPIRYDARFKKMMQPVRAVGDFLYILQNAGDYNRTDNRPFPAFTYQAADDPNLTALRTGFNLDSIAGSGDDVLKVINLLHWVHTLIPHDGNHANPVVKNAMSMIAECKKESRGLNCRGLATVLNECYLAMGFKSRFVTCLPKDSLKTDPDCHVINIVYLPSLKKWVWMDPTNDAYITNEKGELLSIAEVRERLVLNEPVLLNPSANWNNRERQTKEFYLYHYMAKNLYMLQCPVNSSYDLETQQPGKVVSYVTLVPLSYYDQQPSAKKSGNFVYYQTNNPDLFWKTPAEK